MEKSTMRKRTINELKKLPKDVYIAKSRHIRIRLLEMQEFKQADTIAITMSRDTEVETRAIIEECWEMGKKVAIPKTNPAKKEMEFREITSFEQVETVYLDIEEPVPALTQPITTDAIELLIVPGVVFSETGFRIGYGGGYYDRFMAAYSGAVLSVAFELQVQEQVPAEDHDLPVAKIITEERVIECSQRR